MNYHIITNRREIYRKADELGLRDLVLQTEKEIQMLLTGADSGEANFLINKSIKSKSAFVVIIVYNFGLAYAGMVLDWSTDELFQPTPIDEMAQDVAQKMLEILGDRKCKQSLN